MSGTLLEVKNLTCGYGGRPVIYDISFEARAGEKVALLGANGCGKSTLLKAVASLLDYNGEIYACGKNIKSISHKERARLVALMGQINGAPFDFTVYECVSAARYAYGADRGRIFDSDGSEVKRTRCDDIVFESMDFTDVLSLKDRRLSELSGGQLQRVFLARAFAQDPEILLLDEPLNHLDLLSQSRLSEKTAQWAALSERCVIGVFHDINTALSFADKLLIMKDGVLLCVCRAENLNADILNEAYGMDVKAYMMKLLERWL